MSGETRWLLGRRHGSGTAPHVELNDIQRAHRDQVVAKLETGIYGLVDRACPVCGGFDREPVAGRDRYGLPTTTALCRRCGLLQTHPLMRPSDYDDFYRRHYRGLYSGSEQPTGSFFDQQLGQGRIILRWLAERDLLGRRGGTVLEVGCGAGGILAAFDRRGHKTLGVDLGEDYLERGRAAGLDLRQGGVDTLPDEPLADLVIYCHVLEHVLDPRGELEHIRRRLRPGGLLYVEVPGVRNAWRAYQGDLLSYWQNAHLWHFSLGTLDNLLGLGRFSRIQGTEYVRAVYRPVPAARPWTPEYRRVRRSLLRTERCQPLLRQAYRLPGAWRVLRD